MTLAAAIHTHLTQYFQIIERCHVTLFSSASKPFDGQIFVRVYPMAMHIKPSEGVLRRGISLFSGTTVPVDSIAVIFIYDPPVMKVVTQVGLGPGLTFTGRKLNRLQGK